MRVWSLTELNLSWADPGDLIVKCYFESGSESRQAVLRCSSCSKDLFNLSIVVVRLIPPPPHTDPCMTMSFMFIFSVMFPFTLTAICAVLFSM